jgi:hypothetical protein
MTASLTFTPILHCKTTVLPVLVVLPPTSRSIVTNHNLPATAITPQVPVVASGALLIRVNLTIQAVAAVMAGVPGAALPTVLALADPAAMVVAAGRSAEDWYQKVVQFNPQNSREHIGITTSGIRVFANSNYRWVIL